MSRCAQPDCSTPSKSSCSVCEREQYCGSNCQKVDWKIHKSMCPILKNLSTKLKPFHEVIRIKDEISASKKGKDCRVLEHLLSYLEYQFGQKVAGIDYRERKSSERIEILQDIYSQLADLYLHNSSISMISCYEMSFPYLERSLSLLNPWLIQLDLDNGDQIDSCNDRQMNYLLQKICFLRAEYGSSDYE
jgi:hypothetical protein